MLLSLLLHGNQLKRTVRSGWAMRGVPDPESVAEHTFGVAFTALALAPHLDEPVDLGRLLALAVIHDLPEGLTTDLPAPVWRRLPKDIKPAVEQTALEAILADAPDRVALQGLWDELQTNETIEARLVHEADKLEMFLQAHIYQQQYGNRFLDEFWVAPRRFEFAIVQALYDELRAQHAPPADGASAPD